MLKATKYPRKYKNLILKYINKTGNFAKLHLSVCLLATHIIFQLSIYLSSWLKYLVNHLYLALDNIFVIIFLF